MNLTPFRRRAGLTQAELARRLGIRPETYCRIENGAQLLSEVMEQRIARVLDLTHEERTIAFGFPGAAELIRRQRKEALERDTLAAGLAAHTPSLSACTDTRTRRA